MVIITIPSAFGDYVVFLRLYPQLRGFVTMFDDLTKMDWFREHAQKNRVPVNVLFNHF